MRTDGDVPHLPGFDLGAVREGGGGAAERTDAVPPLLALRRGKAVRLLDREGISRGVRHVLLLGHPVQPRERTTRRDVRDAQDHTGSGTHRSREAGEAVPGQPGLAARLGICEGLRGVYVADPAAGEAGGLRDRNGRAALGKGVLLPGLQACGHRTGIQGRRHRREGIRQGHGQVSGGGEQGLLPSDRRGEPVGRPDEGERETEMEPADDLV